MIDPKYLREHADEMKANVVARRMTVDVDAYLALDEQRLTLLRQVEELRRERNDVANTIPSLTGGARAASIERGKALKTQLAQEEAKLTLLETSTHELLLQLPNFTHPDAPLGGSDAENREVSRTGEIKPLTNPRSHTELASALDLLDFERGAKVAGAKFYFVKRDLVILEQALILWTLQELRREGFIPLETPDIAKHEVLIGAGFQPRGEETQTYAIEGTDLALIGTAEIPMGGFHQEEILDEASLPLKYAGLSHCFRTEAGSYGRESYGLYRVHQFTKVEMFVVATREQSEALLEDLRRLEERIFTKLGIPFRVVDTCTADLGAPASRKYDLEAWMWGKKNGTGDWGEVTSTSNCTDYQARRLGIRVRRADGSLEFAHTLNGTAVALSRAMIAILENYQQEDGSIRVPDVLQPLCGFSLLT